ncbi:MAG: DUF86 domain-containing protein [Kiritimatiellae bacterium]|nr:DUF86 domain-containing protein [Kiritimatiellia bacterium]
MTDPSLYRDDSRVRHMLDAMQRIVELSRDLGRAQLRKHENVTEMILFNLMVLGEAANNITREFAAKNPDIDWKGLSGVRHKIVHDYADIDYDTIWDILQNDIPDQYNKVVALAATLPPEPTEPPPNIDDFL